MQDHEEIFKPLVGEDVSKHVQKIKSTERWSGAPEMYALSLLYGLSFKIFKEVGQPPEKVACPDSKNQLLLVGYNYNRFDLIHTKKHIAIHAVAQSIVYEVLYKRTFSLGEDVDLAVYKMLHDKEYSKKRRLQQHLQACEKQSSLDGSVYEEHNEIVDNEEDPALFIRQALAKGMPPFPYKVAKSLDPNISRNTEYDVWNEERKCKLDEFVTPALAPGVKCLVHKEDSEPFVGYIQEMLANGKVTVYMEEMCEKWTVDDDQLQAVPIPAYQAMMHNFARPYRYHGEWGRFDFGKTKKKGFRKHCKPDSEKVNIDENQGGNPVDDSEVTTMRKICNNKCFNTFPKYRGSPEFENRKGNRSKAFYEGNTVCSSGTKPKLLQSPVSKRSAPIPVPVPLQSINQSRNVPIENMHHFFPVNQYQAQEFSPEAYSHTYPVLTYTPGEETYDPTAAAGAIPKGRSMPYSYPENASHLQFIDPSYQPVPPDSNAIGSVHVSPYFYQNEQPCVLYNCEPPAEPITGVSSFFMNTPPPCSGISVSYMPYVSPTYGTPLPMTAMPLCHQCPPTIINSMGSFPHPLTPPHTPSAAPCHFQEVAHPQYVHPFTQFTPGSLFYAPCADPTMTIPAGPIPAPYQPDQSMM